jgi:cation diffusion facilitator family transporter
MEYLTGLAVAAMILVIGFELALSSLRKILNPTPVVFSLTAGAVLLGTIAVKLWLCLFYRQLGQRIRSAALLTTAMDSRNDMFATAAVLISMAVEKLTDLRIDGCIGLGVAVFILISGLKMAKETISPLLGEAADPELRRELASLFDGENAVLGYHDLMIHDYGPGKRFASIHVEMDKDLDPLLCHEIIDRLERECLDRHGVHMVIHFDPVDTRDPVLNRMRRRVATLLRLRDPRLAIHDFRMVAGEDCTELYFDVALPSDLNGQEDSLRQALVTALNSLDDGTYCLRITFDPAEYSGK